MGYDYDKLYGETTDALGPPTPVFVDFFKQLNEPNLRILDVGCGQGRDALFIARLGHDVVGVDISPNGIRDLKTVAKKENLPIQGIVSDITHYSPEGEFDIVLIDRTLHMLPLDQRIGVLRIMLGSIANHGWLLIADEPSNIDAFADTIDAHGTVWKTELRKRGYLFVRRM